MKICHMYPCIGGLCLIAKYSQALCLRLSQHICILHQTATGSMLQFFFFFLSLKVSTEQTFVLELVVLKFGGSWLLSALSFTQMKYFIIVFSTS